MVKNPLYGIYGLVMLALLIVFSFSRRSGPVRDLPLPTRAAPIEFLDALGSLYRNAGAASTVVSVAWERFRRHALQICGMRGTQMGAAELAQVIRRRFPNSDPGLEADLAPAHRVTEIDCLGGHSGNALLLQSVLEGLLRYGNSAPIGIRRNDGDLLPGAGDAHYFLGQHRAQRLARSKQNLRLLGCAGKQEQHPCGKKK